jgi:ABC-2 type transport system permease protein
MWAITVKELLQLKRDKRTLAMMFMLPFVFLIVFGYAASFDVKEISTLVVGPRAAAAQALLPEQFKVVATDPQGDRADAVEALRRGEAIAAVVTPQEPGARPQLLLDGTELFATQAAEIAAADAAPASGTAVEIEPEVLFNPELRTSVIMVPGLVGIILVFIGTLATALGVVRERATGTLEQLAVMPFRAGDVFIGKIAPYFLVAALDLIVVVLVGMLVFDVPFRGSVLTFALGSLIFLFVTLGIGVLISTVSQTQGQAIQLAMMTLLPQFLLSGLFFPLYSMVPAVRWIGYLVPLTYYIRISRGVMVRGTPIEALWLPFLMLTVLSCVVFGLSVLRFRRDLAPSARRGRHRKPAATHPTMGAATGGDL